MRRPCILIVTACLLGELLGYYISILKLGVICVIPVSVCFILVFKKTIQIKKIYILIFFIVFSIFALRIKYEIRFEKEFVSQNMNNVKENSGICGNIKSISFKDDRVIFISKGMIYYLDADKFDGDIHIGNKVCFYGKVEQISSGSNPGEFDAKSYYRTKSIYCKMTVKKYTVVDKSYDFTGQFFFNLRQYLIRRIDSIFDSKSAGLIKAIILGVRADLDRDVYKMYQKNGIAHLLAISGLHVSLLGIGLYKLLRKVLQRSFLFSAGFSSIFLLFYGLLVGDGVSIARAGSMLVLYFIAEVLGRSYCLISALCISATAICLISPFEVFGVGFQLSFGAVLSLGGVLAFVLKKLKKAKKSCSEKIFEIILVSVGVQVLTLPLVLYYFYSFPVYAFLLNIVAIPLMSFVLYSAILSIVLNMMSLFLYKYIGLIAVCILNFYEFICTAASHLPYHRIVFGRPGFIQILIYYTVLAAVATLSIFKRKRVILLLCIPSVFILFPFFKNDEVVYLDVGQGDGIYMHVDDMDILIDCGSTSKLSLGEYTMEPFLLYKGVDDIEMSFVTHSDIDHISGVLYLLDSDIRIKNLYLPYQAMNDASYDELKQKAINSGTNVMYLSRGDHLKLGHLKIDCLWPDKNPKENVNEQSQTFIIEVFDKRLLFTGDIGKGSEESILKYGDIGKVDILKVAHHGSKNSSLKAFIENVSPTYAVISYGKNNHYGHPSPKTLDTLREKGCIIYETAKMGAIEVKLR